MSRVDLRAAALSALLSLALLPAALWAQGSPGPQPAPLPPPLAAPQDTPYAGVISLLADFTDTAHRVVQVHETIPVSGQELTLLYPQWIPGNHSPTGPIRAMAGLEITANGRPLTWTRDRVNVYALHVPIPAGVTQLDVVFQYLAPVKPADGRISFDHNFIDLSWNTVALYPAGHFSRQIQFSPAVRLPAGWNYATALSTAGRSGDTVHFANVPFNTLVDSPLYAGENFRQFDLSPSASNRVYLDIFADTPAELAMTPAELELHRNLARQAELLFDSHHYDQYHFLLSLSDTIGGEGLEHHQSSEDGTTANYLTDWAAGVRGRDLLAHEYTHSWNGKFRRPYDLWTPNFNVPMQDDLLWVYEGLTQYYGYVLTARAGMRTPLETRDLMAGIAANYEASPGRDWRPLVDTTNQPTMSQRVPVSWVSWQRGEDYYQESLLIWLGVDTRIREGSNGARSLDDFAKLFYSMDNGSFITRTYTFEDVVHALNQVQPYDWASYLRARVYELHPQVPEAGFTQGGWKLVYNDSQSDWMKHGAPGRGGASYATSIGFSFDKTNQVTNVWWASPAFKAGMAPGMTLLSVNGEVFTDARLRAALLAAEHSQSPLSFVVKRGDQVSTVAVPYHGGLRIPHLERLAGTPDRLDAILAPRR